MDELADNYIERLLNERREALASAPLPVLPAEQREELAELGIDEEEPFVAELVNRFGKIPTEVLEEMSRRKLLWGF